MEEYPGISHYKNTRILGRRFAAALLPRLHHKGATGRVRTGDHQFYATANLDKTSLILAYPKTTFLSRLITGYPGIGHKSGYPGIFRYKSGFGGVSFFQMSLSRRWKSRVAGMARPRCGDSSFSLRYADGDSLARIGLDSDSDVLTA